MNLLVMALMGLFVFVHAGMAQEQTISGKVRLADGRPVAGADVTLFDLRDLQRGAVARAMTDESGYFALPLASLGGLALPQGFALGHNYPNPFNPSTVIPYQLPAATYVRLDVFNVLGQHVATLVDAARPAGFHTAQWDATDAAGQAMAAGVYFYRLTVGGGQQTQRMVLIDGQAGIAAEASSTAVPMSTDMAEREYGLVVSGEGLTTYTDAAFGVRVGMAAIELVVDAAPLTSGNVVAEDILGDVNNDGQVGLEDAMLVVMSRSNPSIVMPNNGSILLGDVNGDGAVNETDVLVLMRYISNPLDGALPAGVGQRIGSGKRTSDDSSEPRNLTNHEQADSWPAWSPDGQHIAFSSNRDSDHEIYVMEKDGSNPRRLTDNLALDEHPAWSPDGRSIVFRSSRDGNGEIYAMDSDGSNPRRLTDNSASDEFPAWSPDGQHIAFSSNRDGSNYEIYVMDSDGSSLRRLTDNLASDRHPAWSPDGPDGQYIAFSSNRDGSNYEIYVMDSDGSNPRRLTNHRRDHKSPAWSADGQYIAFSSNRDGNYEIYVMEKDGSNPRRLTNHKQGDVQPAWSFDGQHIAFSSDRDGKTEIYVVETKVVSDMTKVVPDTTFEKPTRSERIVIDGIEVEAAENEILVFLDEDVSNAELQAVQAVILDRGGSIKSLNLDLRTIQVGITDDSSEQDFINALSRQSGILGANVNEVVVPERSFITSNDQGYRQWRTKPPRSPLAKVPAPTSVSFAGDYWINQIDATRAWAALSDPSVRLVPNAIGVVDTGVPRSQDVLNGARISRYTEEGVSMSSDYSSDPHGSNVTGYAAGYSNGPDRRGVNPHSDVVFVDVLSNDLGHTYVTNLLLGIKIAIDKGASVVNISWGDVSSCTHSAASRQKSRQRWRMNETGVVHYARKHDALLVWSAGNNCEKQDDRLLPLDETGEVDIANTDSWLSHTLIVGASTDAQRDACFSRMGKVVNIMAPGREVGFGTGPGSGTSYAAPMVTGAAGLVRSIERTISAAETRSILVHSAKKAITFNTTCGEPVANSPAGLLNLGNAIESSLIAAGVELMTMDDVRLSRGQTERMQINVTLPAGSVNAIDVGFVIDQSGSYEDDIATLQTRARNIVQSLRSRTDIDVQFGVAGFADFPQGDYGDTGDVPYTLYQDITGAPDALIAAIDKLNKPLMNGGDRPESQYEALFRAAQELGWRDGSLRILLLATDNDFHDSDVEPRYPGAGRQATLARLAEENVIVIGLQSGDSSATAERLQELAEVTGGSVLALDAASSQIVEAVASGLDTALADVDVTLDVLAGQSWVTGVAPTVHEDVRGGQTVSFTVSLKGQRGASVEDLPYNVYIWARGDGSALLSRMKIPIIVPQESE